MADNQETQGPDAQSEAGLSNAFLTNLFSSLASGRAQLGLALVLAVAFPFLARIGLDFESIENIALRYTAAASAIAVTTGFFIFRRFDKHPEIELPAYIIVSFLASFGAVAVFFLFMRMDYNRYMLISSFAVSIGFFLAIVPALARFRGVSFAIIPGGDALQVLNVKPEAARELAGIDEKLKQTEHVVIDLHHDHSDDWERFIADCTLKGIPVYHYKQVLEQITGKVDIDRLSENNFGSILPDDFYLKTKYAIDLLKTILVLPVVLPLCLVVAVVLRVTDGGPVIFKQRRMGYGGLPFVAYKFRTMVSNGNTVAADLISEAMTKPGDPRITKIGAVLRRFRLDELPQIVNIARGEMSWIGPRPEAEVLALYYEQEIPFYRYRHAVRPGLTGWAQVKQGHVTSVDDVREKLKFDFYYIKNISLSLDIIVALLTVKTVIFGRGVK